MLLRGSQRLRPHSISSARDRLIASHRAGCSRPWVPRERLFGSALKRLSPRFAHLSPWRRAARRGMFA